MFNKDLDKKISVFRAFISADKDFDGKVDEGEFEGWDIFEEKHLLKKTLGMISAAAAFPQKFGFEFWKGSGNSCSLWSTKWESYHPGKDQFAAIDENGDGAVSFDEWWVASRERTRGMTDVQCPG